MSLERQILFWAVAVAAIFYVVYLLGSTITPFAAGIVLGYLLDPIVLKLQSLGLNRLGATLLILIAFALGVVIVLILVAPILSNQFIAFSQRLPDYAVRLAGPRRGGGQRPHCEIRRRLAARLGPQPATVERTNSELRQQLCRPGRTLGSQRP